VLGRRAINRGTGILCIATAAVLWGTWPLYARADGPAPEVVAFLTMLVMSAPALFVFRRRDFADRGAVLALVVVGVSDAANVALYFPALARGPAVVAVLTHYLAPTLVTLAAPRLLGEPRSRRVLPASALILTGLGFVLGAGGHTGDWRTTAALGGGSAVFYALNVLGSRRAGRTFSPLAVTALHAVVSALALLAFYGRGALPAAFDAPTRFVLLGALLNGLVGALLFNLALKRLTAQLVGVITYLEPLTAAALGVLVLGQPFTPWSVLGAALVIAAGGWAASERPVSGRGSSA
jgi:drug/metabolite transporter (DMT)-like permease